MKKTALSLLLSSSVTAFSPAFVGRNHASTSLHVSVVRDIINKRTSNPSADRDTESLLHTFETETPESVGVKNPDLRGSKDGKRAARNGKRKAGKNKRKHNFSQQPHLQEDPDLDFFTLHSSAVTHLDEGMPINDIVRAIKRAQNLHDVHDLATIAAFLMNHCDENWGFGYRGSLLSRLAVAALHCGEIEIAERAIQTRRIYERPSMQPHESAAIVRGLMRVGKVEEGWEVLEDELRLPMEGVDLQIENSQEILKQRSRSLASIASRFFYEGEPYEAARALNELGSLGRAVNDSKVDSSSLDIPWARLVNAATACETVVTENSSQATRSSDLTELVWNAMHYFPCPDDEEECSLEDYLAIMP